MYNDYFELLGCEKSFDINQDLLHENYIKLQQLFHPDRQVNKSQMEKVQAIEFTMNLNKAYQVLKNEKKRAEYLLLLKGVLVNQEKDNSFNPDPDMLEQILELTENADIYQLEKLRNECIENFKTYYNNNEFEKSAQAIIKLQYLEKIFI